MAGKVRFPPHCAKPPPFWRDPPRVRDGCGAQANPRRSAEESRRCPPVGSLSRRVGARFLELKGLVQRSPIPSVAQFAEFGGVATPVGNHFHEELQIDRALQQRLHLLPGP